MTKINFGKVLKNVFFLGGGEEKVGVYDFPLKSRSCSGKTLKGFICGISEWEIMNKLKPKEFHNKIIVS